MATIKPFGALRFTSAAGTLEELTCPPYDIISEEERQGYLAQNPHNIIRLELPQEGDDPYKEAGKTLEEWLEENLLACDDPEGLYIYEERFTVSGKPLSIKGLVCRVKLEPFEKGIILPHEETLSKAKEDRFQLMCATGCNFSSVYSLYFDQNGDIYPQLESLSAGAPTLSFDGADGIRHQVWRVTDPDAVAAVCAGFAEKKLYIADGHHRYETALRYREHLRQKGLLTGEDHPANYMMMTLIHMEHPGLVVLPTHRIVHSLPHFDTETLLEGCRSYFDIDLINQSAAEQRLKACAKADEKALVFVAKEGVYLLRLRDQRVMEELLPDRSKACRELCINVLHTLVLERLLGIDQENLASQTNLTYTRDAAEAFDQVAQGSADCAFLVQPTDVEEIAAVAGSGEKMPQKSTYFYPKIITGHLMNHML